MTAQHRATFLISRRRAPRYCKVSIGTPPCPVTIIAMAAPLTDGQIAYDDIAPQTVDQYAKDVGTFLTWAAEPHMEARKRTGIKIFLFLLVFTGVMYGVKKKIWAKVH